MRVRRLERRTLGGHDRPSRRSFGSSTTVIGLSPLSPEVAGRTAANAAPAFRKASAACWFGDGVDGPFAAEYVNRNGLASKRMMFRGPVFLRKNRSEGISRARGRPSPSTWTSPASRCHTRNCSAVVSLICAWPAIVMNVHNANVNKLFLSTASPWWIGFDGSLSALRHVPLLAVAEDTES
jgi:hypothetical protein